MGLEPLASWPPCKPAQRKRHGWQALRSKTKVAKAAGSLATLPQLATFVFAGAITSGGCGARCHGGRSARGLTLLRNPINMLCFPKEVPHVLKGFQPVQTL